MLSQCKQCNGCSACKRHAVTCFDSSSLSTDIPTTDRYETACMPHHRPAMPPDRSGYWCTYHTHKHTHTHMLQGRCMHTDLIAAHGDGEGPAIPEGQEVGLHPFRPMLHPILCAKAVLHPHGHPACILSHPTVFISLLAPFTSSRADTGCLWLTVDKAGHIGAPTIHILTETQ